LNALRAYILKQKFFPDVLGVFINPFFFARLTLAKNIKSFAPELAGKVLDVGCGKKPYKKLFTNVSEYIGMDIENPGHNHQDEDIDVYYDGNKFPFPDHSFDSILTNQVFEHVFNPDQFLAEISRVLKPGGRLLLTVPFVWDEHEQPYDYARYSSFGIKHAIQKHGFKIINHTKSCNDVRAVLQLFSLYIFKAFFSKSKVINALGTLILIAPITLFGILINLIIPKSQDMFLDNIVLAEKS
jgi:SAM-dependent methyltransferase